MTKSMDTGWYYINRATGTDQQVGPLTWEELYSLVAAGTLQSDDLVWHPDLPQWTPVAQISGLAPAPAPMAASAHDYAPAAGNAPAAAPGNERTLAVVGGLVQSSGFMGVKRRTYTLILTDYRIIFAELTREKMSALADQARSDAKTQGKGFLGQWGAQLGASGRYHEIYRQMPPEAALAETPGNFAIDRATIQKVKFRSSTSGDDGTPTSDYVIIRTSAGKYKMQVNGSLSHVRKTFREAGLC
ncbi:DUF4339 domain-containing protein [Propionibacterium sp.]|uniref:DUF4339 domain-containing protein n=1 Tax=Propionibacterium sp. TaxID=1977903 RepID=UPI00345E11D9